MVSRVANNENVRAMTPKRLHNYLKASVRGFSSRAESRALRALIEDTGAENFLTGLLFIQLHAAGHEVSREYPSLTKRRAADIFVYARGGINIEAKQLHLKDGCRFAPQNLANDLKRHGRAQSLGIIYIADERASTMKRHHERFKNANRLAKDDVPTVLAGIRKFFPLVFPRTAAAGLLRKFDGHGGMSLYAFVVRQKRRAGS
jgi:hypothetical protein